MNQQQGSQSTGNGPIAGRMFDVVRQLQKNREKFAGVTRPTPLAQHVRGGEEVMSALYQKKQNEQKQDASSTPGALQEKRSQERGR